MTDYKKCMFEDGTLVPCMTLAKAVTAVPSGNSIGIARWDIVHLDAPMKVTRVLFGIKSKATPKGLLFNFCPWCGERTIPTEA